MPSKTICGRRWRSKPPRITSAYLWTWKPSWKRGLWRWDFRSSPFYATTARALLTLHRYRSFPIKLKKKTDQFPMFCILFNRKGFCWAQVPIRPIPPFTSGGFRWRTPAISKAHRRNSGWQTTKLAARFNWVRWRPTSGWFSTSTKLVMAD